MPHLGTPNFAVDPSSDRETSQRQHWQHRKTVVIAVNSQALSRLEADIRTFPSQLSRRAFRSDAHEHCLGANLVPDALRPFESAITRIGRKNEVATRQCLKPGFVDPLAVCTFGLKRNLKLLRAD